MDTRPRIEGPFDILNMREPGSPEDPGLTCLNIGKQAEADSMIGLNRAVFETPNSALIFDIELVGIEPRDR